MPKKSKTKPEEFKALMEEIANMGDHEVCHSCADELMCNVLEECGYGDGVKIFKEMRKWYA